MGADQEPKDHSGEEADVVAGAVERSKEMLESAGVNASKTGEPDPKAGYGAETLAAAAALSQQDVLRAKTGAVPPEIAAKAAAGWVSSEELAAHGKSLVAGGATSAEAEAAVRGLQAAGAGPQDLKAGYNSSNFEAWRTLGRQDIEGAKSGAVPDEVRRAVEERIRNPNAGTTTTTMPTPEGWTTTPETTATMPTTTLETTAPTATTTVPETTTTTTPPHTTTTMPPMPGDTR